jgi:hypothetical protein
MLISKPMGLAQVGEERCDRYATEQRDELTPSHVLSQAKDNTLYHKPCCASQHFGLPDFRNGSMKSRIDPERSP